MPDGKCFEKITYGHFMTGIDMLCACISDYEKRAGRKFTRILGIPNGGLPVAVWLANRLKLRVQLAIPKKFDSKLVVVEDIVDTGATIKRLRLRKMGLPIFSLYTTNWTDIKPDGFAFEKEDRNCMIVFPWETEETAGYNCTI